MPTLQTKGLILNKKKHGESDDLITIYTPERGKIQAIAKGSRKINSHFSGHLETLNICQFQLYESRYRFTITQAQTEKHFKNICSSLPGSISAFLILEILWKSTEQEESEEAQGLFELTEATLRKIEENNQTFLNIEKFKLKLIEMLGMLPDFTTCALCQKSWNTNETGWISEQKNLYCTVCTKKSTEKFHKINFNIIKLIRFLLQSDLNKQKILLTHQQQYELTFITNHFLKNYIAQDIYTERMRIKMP